MKNMAYKIWNAVTWGLTALMIILAIALAGVRLVGLRPLAVLSGSMEPAYHVGSLIYVKSVDAASLQPGDVITFLLDADTLATHRIVEVIPDPEDPTVLRYRTQGDANATADGSLVHCKNVIGTPVFSIPLLGFLAHFIQTPPGIYIAISGGAFLLLLMLLPDLFRNVSGKRKAGSRTEPT